MRPKRLISLLVAVCMMITMLPLSAVTAFAADTSSSTEQEIRVGDYKYAYKVNADGATITDFLGPVDSANNGPYDIDIPEKLDGYTVTGLGKDSFSIDDLYSPLYEIHHTKIHSVTIPQSVTSIGDSAFAGCHNLVSLTINDAATSIGRRAFAECPLTTTLELGENITTIGNSAFYDCRGLKNVTIPQSVTSIGDSAFGECSSLETLSLGENIKTIGDSAFYHCINLGKDDLTSVTIPQSVTSIGKDAFRFCNNMKSLTINGAIESMGARAFAGCISLKTLSLGENIKRIGHFAFADCSSLTNVTIPQSVTSIGNYVFRYCTLLKNVTIPEKVTTIGLGTFSYCKQLEYIMLPAGLTSFRDSLEGCPDGCVIYYNNDEATADERFGSHTELAGHKLLCLCKVTFDANGGELNDYDGNLTDHAVVPVYRTEKITETKANDLKADDPNAIPNPTRAGYNFTGWYTKDGTSLNVNDIITKNMTEDITFYAHWAPVYHPLTVTGGTVTVKNGDKDVTDTLTVTTNETTGKKTYSVPDGAEVTVTLDKNTVPEGKVFDGWSTSLPTGQDYKAESITFSMSNDMNVSAKYRDAATDHTPDTAVCHPLTVTGGIVTVKKGDKDVTDTLTVTTDATTGKKTYSVPDGAEVTVTLDKTLIPEGMVFDIWSTGKLSLPLGQDYKAESITFPMSSDVVDIAAQYRDASIEDDGPNVLGTAAIIGTAAVGTAVLGYQAYSLGAEFAGKLMALPYFPSNRSALAMMLWEDAGKPMPESELLYPDVGQEERDMDLQHAARWAMENELIPDLNDEGTAPEEMKFFPANPVSKLDVLNAWQKAQELKNN